MADFVSARNVAAKLCDQNDHPAGRYVLRGFSFIPVDLVTTQMSFLRSYGLFLSKPRDFAILVQNF